MLADQISYELTKYSTPPEERGYHELSLAIISVAVKDYRRSFGRNSKREKELREFFLSEMFECISGCENPARFLRDLDAKITAEKRNR